MPPAPLLDPALQKSNPQFTLFYHHLTTNLLDKGDCSTIAKNRAYESSGVSAGLGDLRRKEIKEDLLVRCLEALSMKGDFEGGRSAALNDGDSGHGDGERMREILRIMVACVLDPEAHLSEEERELLEPDVVAFQRLIVQGHLPDLIRDELMSQEKWVSDVVGLSAQHRSIPWETTGSGRPPGRNGEECNFQVYPSQRHTVSSTTVLPSTTKTTAVPNPQVTTATTGRSLSTSSLSTNLRSLQTHLHTLQTHTLPKTLKHLSTTLSTHLLDQKHQMRSHLQEIETSKHGIQSRHSQVKAKFLQHVAEAIELKSRIALLEEVVRFSEAGTMEDLYRKVERGRKEMEQLVHREGELRDVLAEYGYRDQGLGSGDEEDDRKEGGLSREEWLVMKRLGEKYVEIESEIDTVKRDIDRLEGQKGGRRVDL